MSEPLHAVTTTGTNGHLLKRLSTLSTVAMAFAILNTWIALAGSMGLVLPSGGPVVFLYGFIFCVACNFALVISLGELAAIWPTAGGQYHFVYAICTKGWRRPLSFLTGWANIFGWLSVITVQAFFAAQFISAAAVIASYETFQITPAKTYGLFAAVVVSMTAVNIWGNRILGRWNDVALFWSVVGVIVISIILLAMSPKATADFVFTQFDNTTGWPDGMAWLLGLLQPALSLIGFDVVMHMAEEMPNPSRDVPMAMLGFIFILVTLFCLTDLDTLLASVTGVPIAELILQSTQSRGAATFLNLLMAVCFINGTSASITSASRLLMAMARDKGTPYSHYFSRISRTLDVPVHSVVACTIFNLIFGLLFLGPSVAFSAYMSSCTIFLNVSYALPIIVLLIRGRGMLAEHRQQGGFKVPHQLGNGWGYFLNIVASLYVIMITVLFSFPTVLPVSGQTMNYVIVVFGIFAIFIGAYWLVSGKSFVGPDFERLIGTGNRGVLEATSSVAENGRGDSEEGKSEKNGQAQVAV
ncbi:amino acid/polyamine transporter I [Microdochium bolleyi]|uniref:Amino acid/polyamine transporter I n=1 Tax=Microdochium bolleyi TaxID=196109 RepID=A0A136ILR7_9PEZI|nr:amino acid/polyamine transporter I [Microdochium bolleyi]